MDAAALAALAGGAGRSDQRISAAGQRQDGHAALSPGLFAGPGALRTNPGTQGSGGAPQAAHTVSGASGARLLADWSDARAARAARQGTAVARSRSQPASAHPNPNTEPQPDSRGAPRPPGSLQMVDGPGNGFARGPTATQRPLHQAGAGSGSGATPAFTHGTTLSAVTGAELLAELRGQRVGAPRGPRGGPTGGGQSSQALRGPLRGTPGSASDVLGGGAAPRAPTWRGPRPPPRVPPRAAAAAAAWAADRGRARRVSGAFAGLSGAGWPPAPAAPYLSARQPRLGLLLAPAALQAAFLAPAEPWARRLAPGSGGFGAQRAGGPTAWGDSVSEAPPPAPRRTSLTDLLEAPDVDETSASAPTALPGAPGSAAALASARAPGVRPAPSDAAGPPRRTVRFVEPGGAGPGPDGGPSSTSGMRRPWRPELRARPAAQRWALGPAWGMATWERARRACTRRAAWRRRRGRGQGWGSMGGAGWGWGAPLPTPTELLGSVPGPGVAPGLVAAHGQALSGEPEAPLPSPAAADAVQAADVARGERFRPGASGGLSAGAQTRAHELDIVVEP